MMRPSSILSRILWLHALAMFITALVAGASVALLLENTGRRLQNQTLTAYANTLAAGLRREGSGWAITPETGLALRGGGSSFSFTIVERGRRLSLADLPTAPEGPLPLAPTPTFFERMQGRALYSGVSVPVAGVDDLWAIVVQNLDHPDVIFDDVETRVLLVGLLLILLLLAMLLATDVWIVRLTLAPVRRASAAVASIDTRTPEAGIDTRDLPGEVLPLAQAFNDSLRRLLDAYRVEKEFAADAAHELRTPLAILRLRAEEIPEGDNARKIIIQIEQVEKIVDRLLLLAEIEASAPQAERIDLGDLAEGRLASIAPLAIARRQSIELSRKEPEIVEAAPLHAARAIDAVIENAVRHTPPGTRIVVRIEGASLHVADEGPGLGMDAQEVFQRFRRADRQTEGGSGLGLSIAARIMERMGGSIEVRPNAPSGVTFSLLFKKATPNA
ncbi:MAG: HAMP domain-containing histidine kinase [Alphaproteobacteria bacterium]|nr:HAMP domain-containing histidine kinase [Alphaproteobacteria bacterium]MBM3652610.1 HAMP domain-containing histidine kinase [Alphaproteobacteria bacterium]